MDSEEDPPTAPWKDFEIAVEQQDPRQEARKDPVMVIGRDTMAPMFYIFLLCVLPFLMLTFANTLGNAGTYIFSNVSPCLSRIMKDY